MRNLILSFSGTGNTARLAGIVAKALREAGQEAAELSISLERPEAPDFALFDRLIVAYPVYAMAPPVFVKRFLKRMPRAAKVNGVAQRAAVIAVDGGGGGPAADRGAAALRRKGYDIRMRALASYPENWTQFGGVLSDEAAVASRVAAGDERAAFLAAKLASDEAYDQRPSLGYVLAGYPMGFLFGALGRRFLGKFYADDADCNGCGLCARACPARTIVMEGGPKPRPYWRMNCENCNRCINVCPKRAINASPASIAFQLASIVALCVGGILLLDGAWPAIGGSLGQLEGPFRVLAVLTVIVLAHFVSVGPLDFFLYRWLRRVPAVRRLLSITFTKGFRRYLAPGFKPLSRP